MLAATIAMLGLFGALTTNALNNAWAISSDNTDISATGTLDKFGVQEIYPTKDGQEWYVNMDNPTSDPNFRNLNNINFSQNPDGSWQVSAGQIRMEAWSPENQKWQNVEMTEYAKIIGGSNELLQMYSRGGHHTSKDPCLGSAYKARLYGNGIAAWVKEVTHPAYAGNRGTVKATTSSLEGRWVGFKAVIYNFVGADGNTYVRMESYIDDSVDQSGNLVIDNNWKLASVYEDRGGWATHDSDFDSQCGRARDTILTGPGGSPTQNIAAFRSDGLTWDFKYLSVREIQPPSSVAEQSSSIAPESQNDTVLSTPIAQDELTTNMTVADPTPANSTADDVVPVDSVTDCNAFGMSLSGCVVLDSEHVDNSYNEITTTADHVLINITKAETANSIITVGIASEGVLLGTSAFDLSGFAAGTTLVNIPVTSVDVSGKSSYDILVMTDQTEGISAHIVPAAS